MFVYLDRQRNGWQSTTLKRQKRAWGQQGVEGVCKLLGAAAALALRLFHVCVTVFVDASREEEAKVVEDRVAETTGEAMAAAVVVVAMVVVAMVAASMGVSIGSAVMEAAAMVLARMVATAPLPEHKGGRGPAARTPRVVV